MVARIVLTEILQEFPSKEVSRDEFFAAMHRIWDRIRDKGLKVAEINISFNAPIPNVRFKVVGKEEEKDWLAEDNAGMEVIKEIPAEEKVM